MSEKICLATLKKVLTPKEMQNVKAGSGGGNGGCGAPIVPCSEILFCCSCDTLYILGSNLVCSSSNNNAVNYYNSICPSGGSCEEVARK